MKETQTDKTFPTDIFPLAAFLICESCPLVSCDHTNPRRVIFHFVDSPLRKSLTEKFFSYQALVEPRHFFNAQKNLKETIYQKI